MAPEKDGTRPSLLLAGFAGDKRCFPAPYKHLPVYPLVSPAVDFSFRNVSKLRSSCVNCFPQTSHGDAHNYVDLFEFSKFGGMPYPVLPGARAPSPWFADLRYTIATPLPHSYPSVYEEVLGSERVTAASKAEQSKNVDMTDHQLKKKMTAFYFEIRATLSRFICKICGYLLFKVFRRLMTRLLVSPHQMKQVVEAEKSGIPLVYLPLHRSHLDYLLITWTAWHFGLRLPHIASGDNLNLSGLGWLLRSTGAFFIRRRTDENDESGKDASYRAVLHSYIEQLLRKGLSVEFFLEGTRCRFGKSQLPKHGLISNVVKAVQEKIIQDCFLVPVSYTYDHVAEGVFLDELMGIPKKRESVLGVFCGVLKSFGKPRRCGAVRMHFGEPVLLSDYMNALQEALAVRRAVPQLSRIPHVFSYRELVPWHSGHKEVTDDRSLIRAIGYHIVYEAQSIVSISLVSVVSALLLCKFRQECPDWLKDGALVLERFEPGFVALVRTGPIVTLFKSSLFFKGVPMDVLSADCQWLCDQIVYDGSDVLGWHRGETSGRAAVEYALTYIKYSVDRHLETDTEEFTILPIQTHRQLLNLAFNKNALVPLFALRSAIGLAMVSRCPGVYAFHDIAADAAQICDWMQFEVIFCRPCEDLKALIAVALGRGGLSHAQFGLLSFKGDDEEFFAAGDQPHLEVRDSMSRGLLMFYSNFLRPFLQSLYVAIDRLLLGDVVAKESDMIRRWCTACSKEASRMPFTLLLEAVNSDSLRNSIRLLRHKGIVSDDSQLLQSGQAEAMQAELLRLLAVQ